MHITVIDGTRVVTRSVHRVFASTGAKIAVAGSLQELPLVVEASRPPDLLVVNVSEHLRDWEIAAQLQRCAYRGRVLALVDDLSGASARGLARLGAECLVRPTSTGVLDEVLRRAILSSLG